MWIKVFVKVNLSIRNWSISLGLLTITNIFRLISLKKKFKLKGSGGFYFKEYYYISLLNFYLVIIFFKNIITDAEILNKLGIMQSMNMLIMYNDNIIWGFLFDKK